MIPSEPILSEQPIQPEPQFQSYPQPNNQNKSLKLIIGLLSVLLVLILGGMGYLYNQLKSVKQSDKSQISQTPTITPQATAQTEIDSEVPSDWKTYENEQYGYSLKYPNNWKMELQGTSEWEVNGFPMFLPLVGEFYNILSINYGENDEVIQELKSKEYSRININNSDVYVKYHILGGDHYFDNYIIPRKQNAYLSVHLVIEDPNQNINENSEEVEIAKQILSTFRFTGENLAISNDWKSYENLTFNYSLKYPRDWEIFKQTDTDEVMSLRPIGMQEIPIIISVHKQNKNLNTLEWLSSMYSNLSQYTSEKVIIDNKEMIKFYNTNQDNPYPSINYFLVEDDNYYEISCTTLEQQKYIKVFDEILSTFRFTE